MDKSSAPKDILEKIERLERLVRITQEELYTAYQELGHIKAVRALTPLSPSDIIQDISQNQQPSLMNWGISLDSAVHSIVRQGHRGDIKKAVTQVVTDNKGEFMNFNNILYWVNNRLGRNLTRNAVYVTLKRAVANGEMVYDSTKGYALAKPNSVSE